MTDKGSDRKKPFLLLRKQFWLTALKIFLLVFVAGMVILQIPELAYDLGPKSPVVVEGVEQLVPEKFVGRTFATVKGTGNFERAFIYQRYGLTYTYFTLEHYGMKVVVRTFEKVDEEWRKRVQFIGKLQPFDDQPFSYAIRDIYRSTFSEEVPQDAYFLSLYEVPELSGWQLGAVIFAVLLWIGMFYMFFFFRRYPKSPLSPPAESSSQGGTSGREAAVRE